MNVLFKTIFGSHLYGTSTENSDRDYKGIYLPTKKEILLGRYSKTITHTENKPTDSLKNDSNSIDTEYFSLDRFINLACIGDTVTIDMLHSNKENWLNKSFIWQDLHNKRSMFYTKDMKGILGYVKRQVSKYGSKGSRIDSLENLLVVLKDVLDKHNITKFDKNCTIKLDRIVYLLPNDDYCIIKKEFYEVIGKKFNYTEHVWNVYANIQKWLSEYGERAKLAKENKGVDLKAVHHAFRACLQLKEIFETGDLVYPLKDAKFLTDIKIGQYEWTYLAPKLDDLYHEINESSANSDFPDEVDREYWDDYVCNVYYQSMGAQ